MHTNTHMHSPTDTDLCTLRDTDRNTQTYPDTQNTHAHKRRHPETHTLLAKHPWQYLIPGSCSGPSILVLAHRGAPSGFICSCDPEVVLGRVESDDQRGLKDPNCAVLTVQTQLWEVAGALTSKPLLFRDRIDAVLGWWQFPTSVMWGLDLVLQNEGPHINRRKKITSLEGADAGQSPAFRPGRNFKLILSFKSQNSQLGC